MLAVVLWKFELKNLANELGIDGEVIFIGKMDNAIPYIKCFDIGVLPSDSEGFPNVLLEYMASDVAAVATRVGGNVELVEDRVNGILVPKGNHLLLADAICELIKKEDLRDRLRTKAREIVVEHFSWEKKIREFQTYYIKLLQK